MSRVAAPAEQPPGRFAKAAKDDDLCHLLDAYRRAVRAASGPRRLPAVGERRFVVEHVRRGTAELRREYCWRLANAGDDADAESNRRRLESFEASLPAAPSPLIPLGLLLLVVIVAQTLGPLGAGIPSSKTLAQEVSQVQSFDVTQLGATVDALTHASPHAVIFVIWAYAVAAALVLWPLARGYRAARETLGLDGGGADGSVAAEERRAFARVEALPPPERSFDVWPRVYFLAALAALAAMFLLYVVTRDDEASERITD